MKIFFPSGTLYPSQVGGPANTIYWMAKALHQAGVDVTVLTTNTGISSGEVKLNTWLSTDYGKVQYCATRIHYVPLRMIWKSLKCVRQADLIHLNSLFYPPSWIIGSYAVAKRKKVIWSVRGELQESALKFSPVRKKFILGLVDRFLKKRVRFHGTSPSEVARIKSQFGAVQTCELPNFMELPAPVPTPSQQYLLYIGRLHPIKAIDNVLRALASSHKFRNSGLTLKIAGRAEDAPNYDQVLADLSKDLELSNKVEFLGSVKNGAKQQLYAGARFTILASFSENFGNVVVESLAQATPVIASTGTPWKVLEAKSAGYWVTNDVPTLQKTFEQAIDLDKDSYGTMRTNALDLVREQFDIKQNIDKWIALYEKTLNP